MAEYKISQTNTYPDGDVVNENHNNEYDEIVNLVGAICIGNLELPHDLVTQILFKLPVKSLIRFKAVCKPWKLLIDSHVFINSHLHRRNPLHNSFTVHLRKKNPYPFRINYSLGSCNGIICFKTTIPENRLVLLNPSTREFSFLPEECSGDFYGFCYLSQTQEYKVICFKWRNCDTVKDDICSKWRNCDPVKDEICRVDMMILTLGTKTISHRHVEDVTLPGSIVIHPPHPNQATSGGTIFWLGYGVKSEIVICYHVLEDRFSKIDLPPSFVEGDCPVYSLGVFRNSVSMFLHPYCYSTSFDIWILATEDESKVKSWIKYRHVEMDLQQQIYSTKPMNACPDDRWIICSKSRKDAVEHWSCDLFYYDLQTNQVEEYEPPNLGRIIQFVNYVESLVSPKNICSGLMY